MQPASTIVNQTKALMQSNEVYNEPNVGKGQTLTKLTKFKELLITNLIPLLPVHWPYVLKKYKTEQTQQWLMHEYAEQLVELSITGNQLKNGLKKAKAEKWFPTPRDFAMLCKPSLDELGLPSVESGFEQIVERRGRYRNQDYSFSHRILEVIDERIGYRIYRDKLDDFRSVFEAEYHYWVGRFMSNDLPPARKGLGYTAITEAPIDNYIKRFGRHELGDDNLSQKIREFGKDVTNKNKAAQ